MSAQIHLLPCPRCAQKSYTPIEGLRVASPATQPPVITPTGYVLAQRMRCNNCTQLVDLPMSSKGHTCPNCSHSFGGEWIATTPAQASGARAPSLSLSAPPIQLPQQQNAGSAAEVARSLGLGGCV